jgi:hypothetical protein
VASRAENLKLDIERTKQELAEHLAELRVEATAAEKRAAKIASLAVGGVVALVIVRIVWKVVRST